MSFDLLWPLTPDLWPMVLVILRAQITRTVHTLTKFGVSSTFRFVLGRGTLLTPKLLFDLLNSWPLTPWGQISRCAKRASIWQSYIQISELFIVLFWFYSQICEIAYFDLLWPLTFDLWPIVLTLLGAQVSRTMHPLTKVGVNSTFSFGRTQGTVLTP